MKRNILLNWTLFLLFGIILILPVFGINAIPESANYDVNPYDYTIDVMTGDSRLYVFQQIRSSYINEGTKLRIEVVGFNETLIELDQIYYILDGPVYYPDIIFINRSNLLLKDGVGPRMIMTTNNSLISQVYDGIPEWNQDFQPDFVHFSRSNWDKLTGHGSSEDYEYDNSHRFLHRLSFHESHENGHTDIELQSSFEMNPSDYTLGVTVGDSQLYTLKTIKFYDPGQDNYFNDIPIKVKQGDSYIHYNLKQGAQIYIAVTNTSGDYVKFSTTYFPKDGPQINDETVHILDKSTGYFSLRTVFHGPPLLVTTNTTLISEFAPMDFDITDGEMKYYSSWEDTTNNFKPPNMP